MAQIRNVSTDTRYIRYGVPAATEVAPQGVVEVDDDVVESYTSQEFWDAVGSTPDTPSPEATVAEETTEQPEQEG